MNQRKFAAILGTAALALTPFKAAIADDHIEAAALLELGNDSGDWVGNGECDDVRYSGDGMAEILLTDSIGKDATDCGAALEAGTIAANPMHMPPKDDESIIFGDDASSFANDGECDDIRFVGAGSEAMIYIAEDIGHDASDCRRAFEAGLVKWQGSTATPVHGVTANDIIEQIQAGSPKV